MNRPCQRSRLLRVGMAVLALLPAGWWLSEHLAAVTIFRQKHHYHEVGHQFGGWSYLGVSRPSVFRHLGVLPLSAFHVGSTSTDEWDRVIDSLGFLPTGAEPVVSFEPGLRIPYIPEERIALAGWFPPPVFQNGDGWRYLFIPYWLIMLVFPMVWAAVLWAWQRRKRRRAS